MDNTAPKMPRMRPIPIPTKGLSWWKAWWVWLISTRKWEITEDYFFFIAYLGIWVKIPAGFIFDGASVPKIFRPLFSPTGILFIPGLFHDYGYRYGYIRDGNVPEGEQVLLRHFSRTDWDKLFKEVAIQVNGFKYLMNLPYWAVLIGGGFPWRGYRKND